MDESRSKISENKQWLYGLLAFFGGLACIFAVLVFEWLGGLIAATVLVIYIIFEIGDQNHREAQERAAVRQADPPPAT